MKHPIRKFDDPILSVACAPAAKRDQKLEQVMLSECSRLRGLGIAAPQVGVAVRLVYISGIGFMYNPVICARSESASTAREGCLSYPGYAATVTRSETVTVEYQTPKNISDNAEMDAKGIPPGEVTLKTFSGQFARVVQHEVDHLSGVCHVGDVWRKSNRLSKIDKATRARLVAATSPTKIFGGQWVGIPGLSHE